MLVRWFGCHPKNFAAGRSRGLRPELVVIHLMDGSLTGTDVWFNNPAARVSAHYGIGLTGDVHQYVEERDTAFHAGNVTTPRFQQLAVARAANPNAFSIGIEHEGTTATEWTPAMYASSAELVAEVCRRWSIPAEEDHVVLHREIFSNKTCPGMKFDRQKHLAMVREVLPQLAVPAVPMLRTSPAPRVNLRLDANVRESAPSTDARIVRILRKGTLVDVIGFTSNGEMVRNNPCWYATSEGNFLWAGSTDFPQPA